MFVTAQEYTACDSQSDAFTVNGQHTVIYDRDNHENHMVTTFELEWSLW